MARLKVLATEESTGKQIEAQIVKVGLVAFPDEGHICFVDDRNFIVIKIGGNYSKLKRLADSIVSAIDGLAASKMETVQ